MKTQVNIQLWQRKSYLTLCLTMLKQEKQCGNFFIYLLLQCRCSICRHPENQDRILNRIEIFLQVFYLLLYFEHQLNYLFHSRSRFEHFQNLPEIFCQNPSQLQMISFFLKLCVVCHHLLWLVERNFLKYEVISLEIEQISKHRRGFLLKLNSNLKNFLFLRFKTKYLFLFSLIKKIKLILMLI